MRRLTFLVVCLCSAVAGAQSELKLALPDLTVVGLSSQKVPVFSEHLALQLQGAGAQVTTSKDMQQLLGFERQKQLLGCTDLSCTAEIASALGVDGIVGGEIAKLGNVFQVNLKIISAADGRVIAKYQGTANDEAAVLDVLNLGASVLAGDSSNAAGKPLSARAAPNAGAVSRPAWVVLGAGVVVGAVGAGLIGGAYAKRAEIPNARSTQAVRLEDAQAAAATGSAFQTAGWVCVGVGAAAVASGVAWLLLGRKGSAVSAAPAPLPSGGALVVSGEF